MQHWMARPRPEVKQLEWRFVRLERPLAAARERAAAAARRSQSGCSSWNAAFRADECLRADPSVNLIHL